MATKIRHVLIAGMAFTALLGVSWLLHHGASATGIRGDANCDGTVDSVDAMLILQRSAALLEEPPCAAKADVRPDGSLDARDAALILQYEAGLLETLGDPLPSPTPVVTSGAQFSLHGGDCDTKGGAAVCETGFEIGSTAIAVTLGLPEGVSGYRMLNLALVFSLPPGAGYFTPRLTADDWLWPDCASPTSAMLPGGRVELTCSVDPAASLPRIQARWLGSTTTSYAEVP